MTKTPTVTAHRTTVVDNTTRIHTWPCKGDALNDNASVLLSINAGAYSSAINLPLGRAKALAEAIITAAAALDK